MITTGSGLVLLILFLLTLFLLPSLAVWLAVYVAAGRRSQPDAHPTGTTREPEPARPMSAGPDAQCAPVTKPKGSGLGWRRWALLVWGCIGAAVAGARYLYPMYAEGRLRGLDRYASDKISTALAFVASLGFFAGVVAGVVFIAIFQEPIDARIQRRGRRS